MNACMKTKFATFSAPKHPLSYIPYLISYIFCLISFSALAGTPTSFAYQGVLRDETGAPLKQEQATITFRLYNSNEKTATALWEKELNLAIDTNGLFNAELSGGNLAKVIAESEEGGLPLYVGLTVKDSAGEISPRQKMIATPLAAYAQNVANAEGDFTVKGTATFEGAVGMSGASSVFNASNVRTSGNLEVTGTATMNGGTEMNGEVKMTGTMTVAGNGRLMIEGAQMSLPVGVIMMWAGEASEIPTNCWALCDGNTEYELNGKKCKVPDLRNRFIVGAGSDYKVSETGGEKEHTLTTNEMPSHKHATTHTSSNEDAPWKDGSCLITVSNNKGGNVVRDTDYQGGDAAHENRPPYYALCYIIKIK